jgi:hypothetical protein
MANRSPVPPPAHTRFKPGQSGNLRGRPKANAHIRKLARSHAVEAIEALVRIIRDPKAKASAPIAAACAILDRAFGKPGRAVMYEDEKPPVVKIVTTCADWPRESEEGEKRRGSLHLQ